MRHGALILALACLAGCKQDMAEQPKLTAYAPSAIWEDGAAARPQVTGTLARGGLDRLRAADGPPPITAALIARGGERYDIFCTPCHGPTGQGDGRAVQRGFPPPPSYLSARLRGAPARHFFDVITDGYGVMYPYGDRVPPRDRWAIIGYIRALQAAAPDVAADHPARAAVPMGGRGDD